MWFKKLILFFLASCTSVSYENAYRLDKRILEGKSVPSLRHAGNGQWDNYQTMNLPYSPSAGLFNQIVNREKKSMITRGEAHITVVTPIEFWNILKPVGVTIEEVQKISESSNIQSSAIHVICLGMGEANIGGNKEKTFFVVVESNDLISIREKIQKLYVTKGGGKDSFKPEKFHPHITIGFTLRDLHESDGVIKDNRSCFAPLEIF